ncbi:MAG: hypothetical protein V3W34_14585 [Phycisphaerae bacterium]
MRTSIDNDRNTRINRPPRFNGPKVSGRCVALLAAACLIMGPAAYGRAPVLPMATLAALSGSVFAQDESSQDTTPTLVTEVFQSEPVVPHVFIGDLRDLPKAKPWQPGDPIVKRPRRITNPAALTRTVPQPSEPRPDPLCFRQESAPLGPPTVLVTGLNFEGQSFTGSYPPDTVGDVGTNFYIQTVNGSAVGSLVNIYDKTTGDLMAGPIALESIWTASGGTGACASGGGDPIVLYDHLAGRWLMSEFPAPTSTQPAPLNDRHLCVYISMTGNPVTGGWCVYDFVTPQFPDYPKYAVWPDAYYVSTNESTPAAYALDRTNMLAGSPATLQRAPGMPPTLAGAPSLDGFGFQALTPSDLDGPTPPPAGSPNFFMRHVDDEVHSAMPDPIADFLQIWEFHVDFADSAHSSFVLRNTIPISEFESELCGLTSSSCFRQPLPGPPLDPLREVIMWRLQYRNFGTHETLLGSFVTDVFGGAADRGGIRWFELRRVGAGSWTLFQEGTHFIELNFWMSSIAMNVVGDIAMGYSVTDAFGPFPSIEVAGRVAGDPLGMMTTVVGVMAGHGSQPFNNWGDYSSMNVDPVDDCTFWYTNEYIAANGLWRTRIANFQFGGGGPPCVGPGVENCCVPGGSCGPVAIGTCVGTIVPACLGDGNSDGMDDACEETCCFPFTPAPAGFAPCGPAPIGSCGPAGGIVVTACMGDADGDGINDACESTCCFPFTPPPAGFSACGPLADISTCLTAGGGFGGIVVLACLGDADGDGLDDACDQTPPPWARELLLPLPSRVFHLLAGTQRHLCRGVGRDRRPRVSGRCRRRPH